MIDFKFISFNLLYGDNKYFLLEQEICVPTFQNNLTLWSTLKQRVCFSNAGLPPAFNNMKSRNVNYLV